MRLVRRLQILVITSQNRSRNNSWLIFSGTVSCSFFIEEFLNITSKLSRAAHINPEHSSLGCKRLPESAYVELSLLFSLRINYQWPWRLNLASRKSFLAVSRQYLVVSHISTSMKPDLVNWP